MDAASVPGLDAYPAGAGFFETMRSVDGKVLHESLHTARAEKAMAHFGFDMMDQFQAAVHALAGSNTRIRVQVTADDVAALAQPFQAYPPQVVQDGICVDLSPVQLLPGPSPGFKPLPFAPYLEAKSACTLDDALLSDGQAVVEATTSNVIARIGDDVYAPGPADGAVDGITRQRLASGPRGAIPMPLLSQIDEMVLANTTGVRPVRELCGRPLAIGTWTRRLQERA